MSVRSVASLVLLVLALPTFTSCGVLVGTAAQIAKDRKEGVDSTAIPEDTSGGRPGNEGPSYLRKGVDEAVVRIIARGNFYSSDKRSYVDYRGTGILLDDGGTVVTNYHVVAGARSVRVYLNSGGVAEGKPRVAKVTGESECLDAAVLDIPGPVPAHATLAETLPREGSEVRALGYSNGQEILRSGDGHVLRLAEIKGLGRGDGKAVFDPPEHIIFHNAPAKPGFSGGPLVDKAGDVVGVDYTFSEDLGYGQSIPAEDLVRFLPRFRSVVISPT